MKWIETSAPPPPSPISFPSMLQALSGVVGDPCQDGESDFQEGDPVIVSYLGIVVLPCCITQLPDRITFTSSRAWSCPCLRCESYDPLSVCVLSPYSLLHGRACEPFYSTCTRDPSTSYCSSIASPPLVGHVDGADRSLLRVDGKGIQ